MRTNPVYERLFELWFGEDWQCPKCENESWAMNDANDGHVCTQCGHAESLGRLAGMDAAADRHGRIDYRLLLNVIDEGAKSQHYGSKRWFCQIALIHAGLIYARVPVPNDPIFHNAEAARDYVEDKLFPRGIKCPHCGDRKSRYRRLHDGRYSCGLRKKRNCTGPSQFSPYIGTPIYRTKLGFDVWLRALWALKNGTGAKDHRYLGEVMYGDDFKAQDIRTVRDIADKLAADTQFCDVVGDEFDMQARNPKFVRAYLAHKKGDLHEKVLI